MAQAHIVYHRQEWFVDSGLSLRETLTQIGLDPDQVVPIRNHQVITGAAIVAPGDEIRLVNVIAGG
ncbi:MAG: MoaD/ThiS family protein [Anaerolineae bacterium]